jgi:hypothetical protein
MKTNQSNFDIKIISASVFVGIMIYIIDSFTDSYHLNRDFIQELINPHLIEILERGMFIFLTVFVGIIASSLIIKLRKANEEIKTLNGILPICASCKKIRDINDNWQQIEVYIRDRSEAEFSHGICPDCKEKLYPDFVNRKKI